MLALSHINMRLLTVVLYIIVLLSNTHLTGSEDAGMNRMNMNYDN